MQKTFQLTAPISRLTVLFGCALMGLLLSGCGEQAPYPEPKVSTPLGRPGFCARCEKKIDTVNDKHLVVYDGIQYIVCDEKCAVELKEWLARQ